MLTNIEKELRLKVNREFVMEAMIASLVAYKNSLNPEFLDFAKWFGQQSIAITNDLQSSETCG